jgi:hypothetical protein
VRRVLFFRRGAKIVLQRKRSQLLILLCTLLASAFWTATSAKASSIVYPLQGNVNPAEGTLEIWFTPMVSNLYPEPKGKKYINVFSLFEMRVDGEWKAAASWYRHRKQLGLKVSMGTPKMRKGLVGLLTKTPLDWKPGEKHCVAFRWKGNHMSLYADGKRIGVRKQVMSFSHPLSNHKLVIGGTKSNNKSPIIIHAVRVSSTARSLEELENATPEADISTTLLDVFDGKPLSKNKQTTAKVIAGMYGETGGKVSGGKPVTEPSPGISLCKTKKTKKAKTKKQ